MVDNRLYFSKHTPTNPREEWLKSHLVFEIRVLDNNIMEYKEGANEWKRMPSM